MTIEEAENNYKFCFGNEGRYMWHEIGEKDYREYCDLNISKEIKAQWDRDIIEEHMDALVSSPEGASSWFKRIIDALARKNCETDVYADRLLKLMVNMVSLDACNKIFIIRYMGEESQFDISGCQFFCMHTPYAERMNDVMQQLMDFDCPDEPMDPRFPKGPNKREMYREAVDLYNRTYEKFARR